jgi:hypothetical protein
MHWYITLCSAKVMHSASKKEVENVFKVLLAVPLGIYGKHQ